jgi:hypothetical protein
MEDGLHLDVTHQASESVTRWTTRLRGDGKRQALEIFHEINGPVPFPDGSPLDGQVLAVLHHAAARGKTLRVHGPLSRSMMRNLHELVLAWNCWKPQHYSRIDIVPDLVVDARRAPGADKAISAFSGGVDACFTAVRHTRHLPENLRFPLSDVLMVHGFDVAVENTGDFSKLADRVRPLLDEIGLALRVMRCNSKQMQPGNWSYSCGLQVAACLHMLAHEFNYGLIGSSEAYDALVIPWGSSPITDHLMSGDRMSIVHDGASFSRTSKVALLTEHPAACRAVKVCYSKRAQGGNCGDCEKCIRTRLNFLAAGVGSPGCFTRPLDLDSIRHIPLRIDLQLSELKGIVRYAKKHGASGRWLHLLEKRIAAGVGTTRGRRIKRRFKNALAVLGLRNKPEPAGIGG